MLQLGIRGLGIARFKFNPISWFLKGEQGAWYDPSDLTTLFQDSAGTIPVTAVEQPVGLMLDKSKGLALGAELVTNGGPFTNTTGWVVRANCTLAVVGNELIGTGTTSGSPYRFYYQTATVIGTTYKVTVNISSLAGTGDLLGVYATVGASLITALNIPTTGIYIIYFTAATTTSYIEFGDVNASTPKYTGISNISVKQIAGNHAFQGDLTTGAAAKRPMLSARTNLLTKTEDFSDAVWVISGTAATPQLDKSVKITSTSNSNHQFYQVVSNTLGDHKVSVLVKKDTSPCFYIGAFNSKGTVYFDLTGVGSVSSTVTPAYSASITPVADGYFLCSVNTASGLTELQFGFLDVVYNGVFGSPWARPIAVATSGYIKSPDLRPTNAGALLPPYQRVNTASDYDTVGFPLYLKANGTSSAMSTNSIDFTATDKMTVVTGVRKLGSTQQTYLAISNAVGGGTGSFIALTDVTTADNYYFAAQSSVVTAAIAKTYISPLSSVVTNQIDFSQAGIADSDRSRINGLVPTLTYAGTPGGTGTFGNYATTLFYQQGANPCNFNGQFYGAIIRGAQSDTASVTQTENYMAQKTGITF